MARGRKPMSKHMLITGGAGFIGANAARKFSDIGWKVTVLDNLSRAGANRNLAWLREQGKVTFTRLDVRDRERLDELFSAEKFDAVLHLAAQVAVTTSVVNPREDFEINALGTLNILEGVRKNCPEAMVIYASTNKVYGAMDSVAVVARERRYEYKILRRGVGEDRPLDFHSPYGCSKGAADQYVLDYARIYGLRTTSLRQSCIYGPRQFGVEDQGWVAWFIIAAVLGRPITIYGDGKQMRDVLHVDDLFDVFKMAINAPDRTSGQAFNVGGGPDNTLSLLELVAILERELDKKLLLKFDDWRPGDQRVFVSNIQKIEQRLSWRPRIGVEDGVRGLIDWIRTNRSLFTN